MNATGDYPLRVPTLREIRAAFGTVAQAATVCGGDLPTLLFCLANPGKLPDARTWGKPDHAKGRALADKLSRARREEIRPRDTCEVLSEAEKIRARAKERREEIKKDGRRLDVLMPSEAAEALATIKAREHETATAIICRLLIAEAKRGNK